MAAVGGVPDLPAGCRSITDVTFGTRPGVVFFGFPVISTGWYPAARVARTHKYLICFFCLS